MRKIIDTTDQATAALETRKNFLKTRQEIVSHCLRLAEEPKKAVEEIISA